MKVEVTKNLRENITSLPIFNSRAHAILEEKFEVNRRCFSQYTDKNLKNVRFVILSDLEEDLSCRLIGGSPKEKSEKKRSELQVT